jgi:hypothetical protein
MAGQLVDLTEKLLELKMAVQKAFLTACLTAVQKDYL